MNVPIALNGYYHYRLVVLSIFISILASYTALDIAERVTSTRGRRQGAWIGAGALAMGGGIWAMHYVGMLAFHLPIPIRYEWPTVILSLFAAILASGAALFVASRRTLEMLASVIGSTIMGAGIAAMHYIGMAAMRLQAMCLYSPAIVALSVVLAILVSFFALHLAFEGRAFHTNWNWGKLTSALMMGLAIPTIHYVGMAAVTYVADPNLPSDLSHGEAVSSLSLAGISLVAVLLLAHICLVAMVDRRLSLKGIQVAQSEVQLQTLFDNMAEGIVVLDRSENVVHMNPCASRLLGLSSSHISFPKVADLVDVFSADGEFLPAEQRPGARAFRGEFQKNYEMAIRPKNTGQTSVVEVTTAPIQGLEDGKPAQVIISYRDITELRRTDEAFARLAAIVESSDDAIIGKDLQGIITSWNRGAEMLFGYRAEEMVGESIRRLLPPNFEHEEDAILARIKTGESVEHFETRRNRKDGKTIDVSVTISPIRNTRGQIIGASKIARDITQKKLIERQLLQSQKMEAIGQLTGGIAHDFNNLLGVIIGNLDLLERRVQGDCESLKRVLTAQKATSRGAALTRRLLAFASNEELNPAPVSLNTAIQNLIELVERTLGPDIRLLTDCEEPTPTVLVDSSALESALINLAVNARDAMPKGGSLVIGTRTVDLDATYPPVKTRELDPGSYAYISVTDTGDGMSKQTLERACEPFFTTKPRHKGTGLGLAMVYGFVKQSGGAIRLYSEEGYGTTVLLYLPLANEPVLVESSVTAQMTGRQGGTVLLVDDEPDLREIASAYLTEMGYKVLEGKDAPSAFEMVRENQAIDLLVTDIIMPGRMNGIELAQKVRELCPGIHVIFTSGFPADALAERSGGKVEGPLLRKPYLRAEFMELVAKSMTRNTPYDEETSRPGEQRAGTGTSI